MNNDWIEWVGGECPVGLYDEISAEYKNGEIRTKDAYRHPWWRKRHNPIIRYKVVREKQPDPHKEWVEIKDGCPMPEENESIVFFQYDAQYSGCFIYGDFKGIESGDKFKPDYWRYPFPNPE